MKKRLIAIALMMSMLLVLFVFAPGAVSADIEEIKVEEPKIEKSVAAEPVVAHKETLVDIAPMAAGTFIPDRPIVLVSSELSKQNPRNNEVVTLTVRFSNTTGETIPGPIDITLSGFSSSTIELVNNDPTRTIPGPAGLGPRGSATFYYEVTVSRSAGIPGATQALKLTANLSYVVPWATPQLQNYTLPVDVNIVRPPTPPTPEKPPPKPEPEKPAPLPPTVPRVIISRHHISSETVYVGQTFELDFTLFNTSRNINVKNMEVTVTDAGGTFYPAAGVNSFFIERLNAQETTELSIQLVARPTDKERFAHAVTINIDYEDMKNNAISTKPTINIPVFHEIRLVTENVSFEDSGNGMGMLTFQAINKGMAALNNVNIRIDGQIAASEGNFFVGNMAPGAVEFFEDDIIVFEFGEVRGEIIIEYEDATGVPGELRIPIVTFIGEPFFPDEGWSGEEVWAPEDGMGEESTTLLWWQWALIIVGGVLVVGGITLGVIKRIKRKKQEAADFDEDIADS